MWPRQIWIKNTEQKQEEYEFPRSFLTLGFFSVYKIVSVLEEMFANDAGQLDVPAVHTSKVQVLDISMNRPLKAIFGKS